MKNLLLSIIFLLTGQSFFAQEAPLKVSDSLYREDQFYAGVTYNLLANKPKELSQNGFSSGFHLGFIRDMPINKKRNVAIGIGLGYSANSYNQNLKITKDATGVYTYEIIEDNTSFTKNKFSQHLIEVPIQFRWRTSTNSEYKFWRIYTGFKTSYVFSNRSKFVGSDSSEKHSNIDSFNNMQYAFTLSLGYNTFNVYLNYALNPIFKKEVLINGNSTNMNAVKIGLMFYIL